MTNIHDSETQLRIRCERLERELKKTDAECDAQLERTHEYMKENVRLRAAIEEALEDLNGYGTRGFTDCFRILRKALDNE